MEESVNRLETIEIGDQTTRILDAGTGERVVVLHGWGGRIESMSPTIACLQSRFRVLALDLPGFGEAPPPSETWGTPDYARWVAEVVRSFGDGPAHFLGHSFGGKVSLNLAAAQPGMVAKLILADASGLRSAPSRTARLKRLASRAGRLLGGLGPPGRGLQRFIYDKVASADYREAGPLRASFVKIVNEDVSELLPQIAAPTLLLWGAQDDDVPVAHARTMERLIPDAGLVILDPAGHFCYLDQPERFCRVVRHFLGQPVTP
jgi:pimeloyl-ACP methyl ester carboxylesterase